MERDQAVAELETSRKAFLEVTSGLSQGQWNFKAAPDRWSVAECAEHIAVTEDLVMNLVTEQALKSPAEPEKRDLVKGKDETIIAMGLDRRTKFKAPEVVQPEHRWATPEEITKHVLENRARTIEFVSSATISWIIRSSRPWISTNGCCSCPRTCGVTPPRFWKLKPIQISRSTDTQSQSLL